MDDKKQDFKTQAEIWQHLLGGGEVECDGEVYCLFNGNISKRTRNKIDSPSVPTFADPWNWRKYREPKTIKHIANIYDDGTACLYENREDADEYPMPDYQKKHRVACVPVTITYTEGEGL